MKTEVIFPKWMIAVYLVFIVSITTGGIIYYQAEREQIRSQVESELTSIVNLKANQIVAWRKEHLASVSIFSESPFFKTTAINWLKYQRKEDYDYLQERMQLPIRYYNNYDVLLVDNQLNIRISVTGFSGCFDDDTDQTIRYVWENNTAAMTDIHTLADKRHPHVGFVSPLFNDDGNAIGAIVFIALAQEFIYPLIEGYPVPHHTAETLLIRKDGEDVLFLNNLRHKKDTALTYRIPLSRTALPAVKAVTGQTETITGIDYRGVRVVAASKQIPQTNWFLLTKIDEKEAYEAWRNRAVAILMVIILLILVMTFFYGAVWLYSKKDYYRRLLQADKEVKRSEEKYQKLFRFSNDGICLHQLIIENGKPVNYVILDVNRQYEIITGITKEKAVNKNATELYGTTAPPYLEIFTEVVLSTNPVTFDAYFEQLQKHFLVNAFLYEEGRFATVFKDITDLKKAQQEIVNNNLLLEARIKERTAELETANKELQAFAYSVSHDLRSPLRAINGFSQMLQNDYSNSMDDNFRRLLGIVRQNAMNMDKLISDMLELARTGRTDMSKDEVDMEELVRSVWDELSSKEIKNRYEVRIEPLPACYGDYSLIRQVVINLLANALKFTSKKEHPIIEIGYTEGEKENEYYVKDNGVGFDSRYISKLFGLFQRLHNTEEFEGTGVGLAIVERIITRHKGKVRAEGDIGKGATFSFSLPKWKLSG